MCYNVLNSIIFYIILSFHIFVFFFFTKQILVTFFECRNYYPEIILLIIISDNRLTYRYT